MKVGFFLMPGHPPERSLYEAHQWDLWFLQLADELGFEEAWIGEHFTSPWEPIPAPDLLIAQALMTTKRIKLATGVHLLPFHHPAELACRVAYLDHIAQGRFMFGIGSAGLPSDWLLFDVDGFKGENREMARESIDIILKLWEADGPFRYEGKFWTVNYPDTMYNLLKFHIKPFQKPHPPIGVASLSPKSPTLMIAGERGFIPLSLGLNKAYIASHWEAVMEGASKSGKQPSRSQWRIVRDIYIADTDEEARYHAIHSMSGRAWREYLLPLFAEFRLLDIFKHDPSVPDDQVTVEYLVDHVWLVGSPRTVLEKIHELYELSGGFGTLLMLIYDHKDYHEPFEKCIRLLATEVMPKIADLAPAGVS